MTRQETLGAVRQAAIEAAAVGDLPNFLAELERVRAEVLLAAASPKSVPPSPRPPGRVLSIQEGATRLGRSRWWVYRNKAILPITRLPTGGIGFDEQSLERWIESRTPQTDLDKHSCQIVRE